MLQATHHLPGGRTRQVYVFGGPEALKKCEEQREPVVHNLPLRPRRSRGFPDMAGLSSTMAGTPHLYTACLEGTLPNDYRIPRNPPELQEVLDRHGLGYEQRARKPGWRIEAPPQGREFCFDRLIHDGTYGDVFKATVTCFAKPPASVAVKLISRACPSLGMEVWCFELWRRSPHPGIVKSLSSDLTAVNMNDLHRERRTCLLMEYLPTNLHLYHQQAVLLNRPTPLPLVKAITLQIIQALAHCHRQFILHGSVTTNNLLFDPDRGTVKLCDFSAARIIRHPTSGLLKAPQPNGLDSNGIRCHSLGIVGYAAPEILRGRKKLTLKADIWSAGCVVGGLLCPREQFFTDEKGQPGRSPQSQLNIISETMGVRALSRIKIVEPPPRTASEGKGWTSRGAGGEPTTSPGEKAQKRYPHEVFVTNEHFAKYGTTFAPETTNDDVYETTALSTKWISLLGENYDPLAASFVADLLQCNPSDRPDSLACQHHPFFASLHPQRRLTRSHTLPPLFNFTQAERLAQKRPVINLDFPSRKHQAFTAKRQESAPELSRPADNTPSSSRVKKVRFRETPTVYPIPPVRAENARRHRRAQEAEEEVKDVIHILSARTLLATRSEQRCLSADDRRKSRTDWPRPEDMERFVQEAKDSVVEELKGVEVFSPTGDETFKSLIKSIGEYQGLAHALLSQRARQRSDIIVTTHEPGTRRKKRESDTRATFRRQFSDKVEQALQAVIDEAAFSRLSPTFHLQNDDNSAPSPSSLYGVRVSQFGETSDGLSRAFEAVFDDDEFLSILGSGRTRIGADQRRSRADDPTQAKSRKKAAEK